MNASIHFSRLLVALLLVAALLSLFAIACVDSGPEPTEDPVDLDPLAPTEEIAPEVDFFGATIAPTTTPTATPRSIADILNATLSPTDLYGPVELVLLTYSGDLTSSVNAYTAFNAPVISSNGHPRSSSEHRMIVGIRGFLPNGRSEIMSFKPSNLTAGLLLDTVVSSGQSFSYDGGALSNSHNGEWIGAVNGALSAGWGEQVMFTGRVRTDEGEFLDGIFSGDEDGVTALFIEQDITNSKNGANGRIESFRGFLRPNDRTLFFSAPLGGETIWDRGAAIVAEGTALEDLAESWSISGSGSLAITGAKTSAAVVQIRKAFWSIPGGGELAFDSGIWYFSTRENKSESVAVSGAKLDGSNITWLSVSGATLSGEDSPVVGFMARYEETDGSVTTSVFNSIWKWDYETVKSTLVVKEGDKFNVGTASAVDERELVNIGDAVVMADGRMVFSASAWTDTNDLIGLLIREGFDGELELIARTDQLPGSTWLQTFAPQQVRQIATNKFGGVAVVLGIGESVWAEDPTGKFSKVLEKGDELSVNGDMKTVEFIELTGGNTTSGRATGFSDNGDLVFRVQFTDGTQAIYYATFSAE